MQSMKEIGPREGAHIPGVPVRTATLFLLAYKHSNNLVRFKKRKNFDCLKFSSIRKISQ